MKNFIKKLIAIVLVLCLCLAMAVQVFAKPDKDNGGGKDKDNGQTGVFIHKAQGLGKNKEEVEITFKRTDEEGNEVDVTYKGTISGETLEIDLGTLENYFDLSNGPIDATFKNNTTGNEGVFQITGKEGNDTAHNPNAGEQDNGNNNFNAYYGNNGSSESSSQTSSRPSSQPSYPSTVIDDDPVPLTSNYVPT